MAQEQGHSGMCPDLCRGFWRDCFPDIFLMNKLYFYEGGVGVINMLLVSEIYNICNVKILNWSLLFLFIKLQHCYLLECPTIRPRWKIIQGWIKNLRATALDVHTKQCLCLKASSGLHLPGKCLGLFWQCFSVCVMPWINQGLELILGLC